jgi:hypothetical protein
VNDQRSQVAFSGIGIATAPIEDRLLETRLLILWLARNCVCDYGPSLVQLVPALVDACKLEHRRHCDCRIAVEFKRALVTLECPIRPIDMGIRLGDASMDACFAGREL